MLMSTVYVAGPGGPVNGPIWLVLHGKAFPADGWDDFVVVVLGWWTAALERLISGSSRREIVDFMDGPYEVELAASDRDVLRIETKRRDEDRGYSHVVDGDMKQVVSQVACQARRVLAECRRLDWWSGDADALRASLQSLEAFNTE